MDIKTAAKAKRTINISPVSKQLDQGDL